MVNHDCENDRERFENDGRPRQKPVGQKLVSESSLKSSRLTYFDVHPTNTDAHLANQND